MSRTGGGIFLAAVLWRILTLLLIISYILHRFDFKDVEWTMLAGAAWAIGDVFAFRFGGIDD